MRDSEAADNFCRNVRLAVEYRDLTFAELAERAKIARPSLSRLMNGKEDATLSRAQKIADVLKIPVGILVGAPNEFQAWIRSRTLLLSR